MALGARDAPPYIIQGPVGTMLGQNLPPSLHELMQVTGGEEALGDIHREYVEHGADFVVAHTFGAQPGRNNALAQSGTEQATNIVTGVAVASKVAAEYGVPVGASVSPISDCYDPTEGLQLPYEELIARQYRFLRLVQEGGAEFVIAETFPSLREAHAIREAADAARMPFGLSFYAVQGEGGDLRLPGESRNNPGPSLGTAAKEILSQGLAPSFLGANCIPLEIALDAVHALRGNGSDDVLIGIWPNGMGVPDNTPVHELSQRARENQEAFTPVLRECILGGAAIVGGCCCTTPEDAMSLRQLVDSWRTSQSRIVGL
jgi:5-methyltetrahydrofolate--homocysteine methyltransferase